MRRDAIHNAHNMSLNEDLLGFNNTLSTNPSSTSRTNLSTLRSLGKIPKIFLILENFPTFATEPDQHQLSAPKLMPLNTHGIKAYTFNTSHGKIEIKEDGWVVLEIAKSKRTIGIAPNGLKVRHKSSLIL